MSEHPALPSKPPSAKVLAPSPPGAPSRRARAALPLSVVGAGMLVRRVTVRPPDVVFFKGVIEASDGLAAVFAEQGGELLIAAPRERAAELDELLADLEAELEALVTVDAPALPSEAP